MGNNGYQQFNKTYVRHNIIQQAVSMLTTRRSEATCVSRDYVRKVYDYFTLTEDLTKNRQEAFKIKRQYILDWEHLHDSFCVPKKPEDLHVCYLCGPEPNNDFDEFVALGVLPQNIWAFEADKKTYAEALRVYSGEGYKQPRIIKQNIEVFFQQTPKAFDIIYIDACGSIPSSRHALKCITAIFSNHRLNSPGIVISNFAEPTDRNEHIDLLSQYFYSKSDYLYHFSEMKNEISTVQYQEIKNKVTQNFPLYYGEFISRVLRDIPGVIVPLQRIWKNPYLKQIFNIQDKCDYTITEHFLNSINDSVLRFFLAYEYLNHNNGKDHRIDAFIEEIGDYSALRKAFIQFQLAKNNEIECTEDVKNSFNVFGDKFAYQFLDKPHSNLLFDVLINQLAYPAHCNTKKVKRFKYTAKETPMYTDITVYDECRYIYEWLPAIHQVKSAFEDLSTQYVFRFALDGLVKSRLNYNNEFFYQGSVISDDYYDGYDFRAQVMEERQEI